MKGLLSTPGAPAVIHKYTYHIHLLFNTYLVSSDSDSASTIINYNIQVNKKERVM